MPRTAAAPRRGALVLAAGLLLTGCASIPSSGPVRQGEPVASAGYDPVIRVLPHPPADGLAPSEVVRGFLAATASFEDDHAVARLYLTTEAAEHWDAAAGVTVYSDDPGVALDSAGATVTAAAVAEARIDRDGLLSPQAGRPIHRPFKLTRVDGQWRISSLRPGLLLSRSDVTRSFRAFDLYFLTPENDRLVPDPVLIPIDRPGAATSMVRALLDGPTPWLAPAVRTAFPAGTTLLVDAVPVENGAAQVDLSADALEASDADRERMAAQLVWSLTQLSEVTGVTITVEGSPLQLPGGPGEQTTASWSRFDPDAEALFPAGYLVTDGGMAEYLDRELTPVPGRLGSGDILLASPTATSAGDLFAAVSPDRSQVLLQSRYEPGVVATVASGTDFAPPSFDAYDRLWLTDRTGGGSLVRVRLPEGRVHRVTAPGLASRGVMELRAAPDGTRVAVVVNRPDGTGRLLIARLVPEERGVVLSALRRLELQLVDVRDVAWSTSDELIVLGRAADSALQPFRVGIDGSLAQAGGSLSGLVGIAAAPGQPMLAATSDGRVWQDSGLGWRGLAEGSDPNYFG